MQRLQRTCSCGGSAGPDGECAECARRRLERKAKEPAPDKAPPVVHEVLRSPGRKLEPDVQAEMDARFGHDFSQVAVHTDARAAESARSVGAVAYTVGRDVVFDQDRYAPGSPEGRRLLVHELTHVVQQDGAAAGGPIEVGASDSPAEAEAERAATTVTATPVSLRRDNGDEETAEEEPVEEIEPTEEEMAAEPVDSARRAAAADGLRVAIDRIRSALQRGYLFEHETIEGDSVTTIEGDVESRAAREARLRRLLTDLRDLLVELDGGKVPDDWFNPQASAPKLRVGVHGTQPWRDAGALYLNRQVSLGRDLSAAGKNVFYIQTAPVSERRTRPAAMAIGVQTGLFLLVPDPENAPLVYERVSPTMTWSSRGTIVEVWRDDLGYYYPYQGKKIYLPGRP
jgi:hypothetical protein